MHGVNIEAYLLEILLILALKAPSFRFLKNYFFSVTPLLELSAAEKQFAQNSTKKP